MPLKEQQDLLAKLYTDPEIQDAYFKDPNAVLQRYGIRDDEAQAFAALADAEIKFFADSLFAKRFREVQKLLSSSARSLGPTFRSHFADFAPTFNPVSVKKHAEDAIAFSEVLLCRSDLTEIQRDAISFESARLRHFANARTISFVKLRHDSRSLADLGQETERQSGIALWLTPSKDTRFIFLKLPF